MTAAEHNKTLATLYFIYGAMHGLSLIGLLLLVLVVKLATPAAEVISGFWFGVSVVIFVVLMLIVGILPVVVGYGFRKRGRWVKPLALALSVVSLVNIPIGTALGIYTQLVHGNDPGVIELAGDLRFLHEPSDRPRVGRLRVHEDTQATVRG